MVKIVILRIGIRGREDFVKNKIQFIITDRKNFWEIYDNKYIEIRPLIKHTAALALFIRL